MEERRQGRIGTAGASVSAQRSAKIEIRNDKRRCMLCNPAALQVVQAARMTKDKRKRNPKTVDVSPPEVQLLIRHQAAEVLHLQEPPDSGVISRLNLLVVRFYRMCSCPSQCYCSS